MLYITFRANDNFSHSFCMSELQLQIVGIHMLLQTAALKRCNVTGSMKRRRDACVNLQLGWTCAHEKDRGGCV